MSEGIGMTTEPTSVGGAWTRFRTHALGCKSACAAVERVVRDGALTSIAAAKNLHGDLCAAGQPLYEEWLLNLDAELLAYKDRQRGRRTA